MRGKGFSGVYFTKDEIQGIINANGLSLMNPALTLNDLPLAPKFGKEDFLATENRVFSGDNSYGITLQDLSFLNLSVYNGTISTTRFWADDVQTNINNTDGTRSIVLDNSEIRANTDNFTILGLSPTLFLWDVNDDVVGFTFKNSSGISHTRFQTEFGGDYAYLISYKYSGPVTSWDMSTGDMSISGSLSSKGINLTYVEKTSTYTIILSDFTINCTSGTFTVNLPTAVGITGQIFNIKNTGPGTITLDGDNSETIDGSLTISLSTGVSRLVQSTGSNWIII